MSETICRAEAHEKNLADRLYDLLKLHQSLHVNDVDRLLFPGGMDEVRFSNNFNWATKASLNDFRFRLFENTLTDTTQKCVDLLCDQDFVVIDIEATGPQLPAHSLLEFAGIHVKGHNSYETFRTLVNPHRIIPISCRRVTKIIPSMVQDAPPVSEALEKIFDFIGDRVIIAHNAPFDLGFLDQCSRHHHGKPLLNYGICTLPLARWSFPTLDRWGLDRLLKFMDLHVTNRHRAMTDAFITMELWYRILDVLEDTHIRTMDDLIAHISHNFIPKISIYMSKSDKEMPSQVPSGPGVYLWEAKDGTLIRTGSTPHLRRHYNTSFLESKKGAPPAQKREQERAHSIHFYPTGSLLEAKIRAYTSGPDTDENCLDWRCGLNVRDFCFLQVSFLSSRVSLSLTNLPKEEASLYYGPFRGIYIVLEALTILARIFSFSTIKRSHLFPFITIDIDTGPSEKSSNMNDFLGLLEGLKALEFFQESLTQQEYRTLQRVLSSRHRIFHSLHNLDMLLVLPEISPSERRIMVMKKGRVKKMTTIGIGPDAENIVIDMLSPEYTLSEPPMIHSRDLLDKAERHCAGTIARQLIQTQGSISWVVPLAELDFFRVQEALYFPGGR